MHPLTRRQSLQQLACGFGYLALAGLAANAAVTAAKNPLAPKTPPLPAKAKRVIFLFMQGGVSHVDSFDYKPRLAQRRRPDDRLRTTRAPSPRPARARQQRVMKPLLGLQAARPDAATGPPSCSRKCAKHVDDLCFIHSMHTEGVAHGPATLFLHTGSTNLIRPSMGSWVTYGLGTENENLPGFVSISPSHGQRRPAQLRQRLSARRLPGHGRSAAPAAPSRRPPSAILPTRVRTPEQQRRQFDLLRDLNAEQLRAQARRRANSRPCINQLRTRLAHAEPRARASSILPSESAATLGALRHRREARPTTSAASASWPAACAKPACATSR